MVDTQLSSTGVPARAHLHGDPELVHLRAEVQSVEGGDVGVSAEVTENQVLLLDLLNIIGHILQNLDSHPTTCTPTFTTVNIQ